MTDKAGLEGVVAARTRLSLVDGERGLLVYRGYLAGELARSRTFEEVAHLLWHGFLPSQQQLEETRYRLAEYRLLPVTVRRVLDALDPELDMMSVLRTAISACRPVQEWPPTAEDAMVFTAMLPTVIAYRWAQQSGRDPIEPDPALPHVANYLYMLTGKRPDPAIARALEAYMVITMEHGLNASTFAARVVTSTQSDMASALCAALGAMKGPLHGGAPSGVMDMLEQIGTIEHAESWLRRELQAGRRLMGFGHRVYKTRDPRAVALRAVVESLRAGDPWFDLAVQVEDLAIHLLAEYKPDRHLYTNVEYWAAAILGTVGIPKALYTATFSASRCVGWTAHILEQADNNRLMRPQSVYIGPLPS